MQHTTLKLALFLFGFIPSVAVYAATITSVTVSPTTARVGEEVRITINGDAEAPNCGIRLQFNDVIPTENFSLADQGGAFPLTLTRTFNRAGSFRIEALGRKAGPLVFRCQGEAATTLTVVTGSSTRASQQLGHTAECPPGWEMVSGQRDPRNGFTCAPKSPATRIECGSGLSYFENDGLIGCKRRH